MTAATSAGLLLHRSRSSGAEVFLGRMGGPFWARRPRAWSVPKGLHTLEEEPLAAARREFEEEIGAPPPKVAYTLLGSYRQSSGKIVTVFVGEGDESVSFVASNTFELEWPRGSGIVREYPEISSARWVGLDEARGLVVAGQVPALDALAERLRDGRPDGAHGG